MIFAMCILLERCLIIGDLMFLMNSPILQQYLMWDVCHIIIITSINLLELF